MAKQLKLRRGTTSQHGSFTGAEGEVTVDTTKDTLVVHDGSTAGGVPLAKEAGNIAVTEAKPIDDFRASQSYRNDLIAVLVTRTINAAIDLADKD